VGKLVVFALPEKPTLKEKEVDRLPVERGVTLDDGGVLMERVTLGGMEGVGIEGFTVKLIETLPVREVEGERLSDCVIEGERVWVPLLVAVKRGAVGDSVVVWDRVMVKVPVRERVAVEKLEGDGVWLGEGGILGELETLGEGV